MKIPECKYWCKKHLRNKLLYNLKRKWISCLFSSLVSSMMNKKQGVVKRGLVKGNSKLDTIIFYKPYCITHFAR